jgi:hypothetical protein
VCIIYDSSKSQSVAINVIHDGVTALKAREASSITVTVHELEAAVANLAELADDEELAEHLPPLLAVMDRLLEWTTNPEHLEGGGGCGGSGGGGGGGGCGGGGGGNGGRHGGGGGGRFESKLRMLLGDDATGMLEGLGLAKVTIPVLQKHFDKMQDILKTGDDDGSGTVRRSVWGGCFSIISSLLLFTSRMLSDIVAVRCLRGFFCSND